MKYHAILEESRRKAAEKWRRRAGEGHLDLILGPRSEIVSPGNFPEQLLVVLGFIGDGMAHTLAGATKPQPVLLYLRILVDRINLSIRPGF